MTSSERVSRQHATCNNKCVTSIGAHKTQAQEQITQNHKYGRQEALSQWMDIAKVYPSIHDTLERKRNRSKNFAPTKIHRIFLYFHFFSSVSGFVRTFSSWPWQRIAPYYSKEDEKSTWSKTQTHTHILCIDGRKHGYCWMVANEKAKEVSSGRKVLRSRSFVALVVTCTRR